jgi:quinate dehydrogenase
MSTVQVVEATSAPAVEAQPKLDRHGYLFGQKIQASMSPLLHQTIYDNLGMRWEQQRYESTDIPEFMRLIQDPSFYGSCFPALSCGWQLTSAWQAPR